MYLILPINFLSLSFTKDLVDSVVVFIVFIFLPVLALPRDFQGLTERPILAPNRALSPLCERMER